MYCIVLLHSLLQLPLLLLLLTLPLLPLSLPLIPLKISSDSTEHRRAVTKVFLSTLPPPPDDTHNTTSTNNTSGGRLSLLKRAQNPLKKSGGVVGLLRDLSGIKNDEDKSIGIQYIESLDHLDYVDKHSQGVSHAHVESMNLPSYLHNELKHSLIRKVVLVLLFILPLILIHTYSYIYTYTSVHSYH